MTRSGVYSLISFYCSYAVHPFCFPVPLQPLVIPVHVLLANRQRWLPCSASLLLPKLLPLVPCVDGIWLVVVVRIFPLALVSFMDLALIYQVGSVKQPPA